MTIASKKLSRLPVPFLSRALQMSVNQAEGLAPLVAVLKAPPKLLLQEIHELMKLLQVDLQPTHN